MKYLSYIIIIILSIILFTRQKEVITVHIPSETNTFERDSSQLKPIVLKDTIKVKGKDSIITVENPVNTELLRQYKASQDSLQKLQLYTDAITKRVYKETYKDSVQTIKVTSEVQGYLIGQKLEYVTNEKNINIPIDKRKYHVFTGATATIPTANDIKPSISLNTHLITPKKLYTVSYDPFNKSISAGVAIKLF